MSDRSKTRVHQAWAHLRFSVVGPLLSAPPGRRELSHAITDLAAKQWRHPVTGDPIQFARSTIERWFYQARRAREDPVRALRRRVRKDAGSHHAVSGQLVQRLMQQYEQYKYWSWKLHYDNLQAAVEKDASLGSMPSYASLCRFMRGHGLEKRRRPRGVHRPGADRATAMLESREVRSFESEYVNGLWHLDFHACSLPVLTATGRWVHPHLLAVMDDHTRLVAHAQWYWTQTTEDLVHGLSQAIYKRGLPRALLTDNGSAMVAEEFVEGLMRLGIVHRPTLPYSPHQNGKQEVFWATVEGRLVAMLQAVKELTLELLNRSTQAWVDMEYNRTVHSETGEKPLDRFLRGQNVGRPSPSTEALNAAFRQEVRRMQRRSDGTLTIEGVRFEIPSRFGHLRQLTLRYARWDLSSVDLVDPRTDSVVTPIYPLNKSSHADGRRRRRTTPLPPAQVPTPAEADKRSQLLPPLLQRLLDQYGPSAIPPAYLPKPQASKQDEEAQS